MREADWDEQLVAVLGRQLGTDPLPVGQRALADVDGDVENSSAHAANQLVLTPRRRLKMQAPQRGFRHGQRVVVLHETASDTDFFKSGFGVYLGKPPAAVAEALWNDQLNRWAIIFHA